MMERRDKGTYQKWWPLVVTMNWNRFRNIFRIRCSIFTTDLNSATASFSRARYYKRGISSTAGVETFISIIYCWLVVAYKGKLSEATLRTKAMLSNNLTTQRLEKRGTLSNDMHKLSFNQVDDVKNKDSWTYPKAIWYLKARLEHQYWFYKKTFTFVSTHDTSGMESYPIS